MKFGRMLALSLVATLAAVPAVYAQDEDLGELTTKKPPRRAQTQAEEESNDLGRKGPLLGLGATYAIENFDGINADGSGGYNAHVGYRFNRWFSSEIAVERYQKFDVKSGDEGRVNGWTLGLDNKVYVLNSRFQPYGLFGIEYYDTETSGEDDGQRTDDGPALRFGGGLDFYLTNKFVLTTTAAYLLGIGNTEDMDLASFSVGFLYRP
jgi:hypothetical protein